MASPDRPHPQIDTQLAQQAQTEPPQQPPQQQPQQQIPQQQIPQQQMPQQPPQPPQQPLQQQPPQQQPQQQIPQQQIPQQQIPQQQMPQQQILQQQMPQQQMPQQQMPQQLMPQQQLPQQQQQMPQQQQAYYGSASPPHAPYGFQQPGYGQMAPPSPSGQPGMQAPQDPYYQYIAPQVSGYPQQVNYPPGYPPQGYLPQGYPPPPPQGYPPPPQGYPQQPQVYAPQPQAYAPSGYLPQGLPYGTQQAFQPMPMAQGQFGPIMKPVSNGYVPTFAEGYMPQKDAMVIYKALSPPGTVDEDALVHILPSLSPAQLTSIHHYLLSENKPSVVISDLVEKRIGSTFRDAVRAVVLGPLEFDVWLLNRAIEGFGTNEIFLSMVLLGRKNGDIEAIKAAYFRKYAKHLIEVIRKELSGQLEALYMDALEARRADESTPVSDDQAELDANELYTAMVGKSEGNKVSEILVTRSDAMIRKIVSKYDGMSHGKSLEKMIEKKFGGGMRTALLYILHGANDRASREAKALEATMKGMGTKDEELSYRLAIMHWDKDFLQLVINSYKKEFANKGSLNARVKGETSGHYGKFLLALLKVP